jgi:hypothetical protein
VALAVENVEKNAGGVVPAVNAEDAQAQADKLQLVVNDGSVFVMQPAGQAQKFVPIPGGAVTQFQSSDFAKITVVKTQEGVYAVANEAANPRVCSLDAEGRVALVPFQHQLRPAQAVCCVATREKIFIRGLQRQERGQRPADVRIEKVGVFAAPVGEEIAAAALRYTVNDGTFLDVQLTSGGRLKWPNARTSRTAQRFMRRVAPRPGIDTEWQGAPPRVPVDLEGR